MDRSASLTDVAAVRFGVAGLAVVAVTTTCRLLHPGLGHVVLAYAAATWALCLVLPWAYAAGIGATAWACLTGFVVNELGQLTFARSDLLRLLLLMSVALGGAAVSIVRHETVVRGETGRPFRDGLSGQRGTRTSRRPWRHSIRSSRPGPTESPSSWRGVSAEARTTTE